MEVVSDVIKFQPNIPVRMRLKFDGARACKSKFTAEDQYMISSDDGRIAFLTPFAHTKFAAAGVTRGDDVEIVQTVLVQGQRKRIDWVVKKVEPEAPAASAEVPASAPAVNPITSSAQTTAPTSVSRPMTTLDDALITAIEACKRAEAHGSAVAYPVKFDKDDVRTMAITLLINKQRELGGAR